MPPVTTATRPSRSKSGSLTRGRPLRVPDGVAELAHAAVPTGTCRGRDRASGTTSCHASAGTAGRPTAARHSASFTSLPRYAVSASEIPRRSACSRSTVSLSSMPPMHSMRIFRARARNGLVRLLREDEVVDADLVETPQAERVAPPAGHALLAALVRPDAVVGEDAVEVEDDEREISRSASSVTRRGRRPARGGLDVLERDGLLVGERPREHAPEEPVELVRRKALRRPATSRRDRPAARTCPAGSSRAATSFFPIFSSGRSSLGSVRLTPSPSATGTRRRSRTNRRIPSGISEYAWSVPFQAWFSVKCFSKTRAPSMNATAPSRSRCGGRRAR